MLSKNWSRLCSVARKTCSQFGGWQARSSGTEGLVFSGHRHFKSDSSGSYPEDEVVNLLAEEWPIVRTSRVQKLLINKLRLVRFEHQVELQSLLHDNELSLKDKDFSLEKTKMELQYTLSEMMRVKSLLNSRGILEYHLREVHNERCPKKNFNAQQICASLDSEKPVESINRKHGGYKILVAET